MVRSTERATAATDSVVITNEDYVTFLSVAGVVPSYIATPAAQGRPAVPRLQLQRLERRSLYRAVTRYRAAQSATTMDYAVLLESVAVRDGFFDKNQIDVFDTPLDLFCQRMGRMSAVAPAVRRIRFWRCDRSGAKTRPASSAATPT